MHTLCMYMYLCVVGVHLSMSAYVEVRGQDQVASLIASPSNFYTVILIFEIWSLGTWNSLFQ